MSLNEASLQKLQGVHPDLVKVAMKAAESEDFPFIVVEGLRTLKRQRELFANGATTTMKSRHLTGHAFDFAPLVAGEVSWKWPAFYPVIDGIRKAAAALAIPVEFGADWKKFKDGPHLQLPWAQYP